MISKLVYLSGYGQFVWPAFMFTYFSCLILYLKTRNDLKKYEELFFKEFTQTNEIETVSSIYQRDANTLDYFNQQI